MGRHHLLRHGSAGHGNEHSNKRSAQHHGAGSFIGKLEVKPSILAFG